MLYHGSSLLLAFAYPLLRLAGVSATPRLRAISMDWPLFSYFSLENLVLLSGLVAVLGKQYNSYSTGQQLNELYRLAKWTNLTLLLFMSFKMAGLYALLALAHLCFVPNLPESTLLQADEASFVRVVERGRPRTYQPAPVEEVKLDFARRDMHFVEFYTNWAEACGNCKEIWNDLAEHFTTPRLKFVSVNIGKYPELAARFSISLSSMSRQLPTLIMFEDGHERLRFPPIDEKGNVPRVLRYERREILRYFWLEERYLLTRDAA
jgi:hypothetical protein